jgi:hypothetical protein
MAIVIDLLMPMKRRELLDGLRRDRSSRQWWWRRPRTT